MSTQVCDSLQILTRRLSKLHFKKKNQCKLFIENNRVFGEEKYGWMYAKLNNLCHLKKELAEFPNPDMNVTFSKLEE